MGDIADMMLEGLLDEETGEYIGDINEEIYGCPDPGFPISYERQRREVRSGAHLKKLKKNYPPKVVCPDCGKSFAMRGILEHWNAKHVEK